MLRRGGIVLVALAIGMACVPEHRRQFRSPWPYVGALLALAIWSPNLVWNARHDWAAVAMLHSLHAENSTLGASIATRWRRAGRKGPLRGCHLRGGTLAPAHFAFAGSRNDRTEGGEEPNRGAISP